MLERTETGSLAAGESGRRGFGFLLLKNEVLANGEAGGVGPAEVMEVRDDIGDVGAVRRDEIDENDEQELVVRTESCGRVSAGGGRQSSALMSVAAAGGVSGMDDREERLVGGSEFGSRPRIRSLQRSADSRTTQPSGSCDERTVGQSRWHPREPTR